MDYHNLLSRLHACHIGVLLGVVLLAGCAPVPPVPTATPPPAPTSSLPVHEIEVNPERTMQTIEDVAGGNFVHRFGGVREALDPVSRFTLENLSPRYVRVNMTLEDWEPVNDDPDPNAFNWDAFHEANFIPGTISFLKTMQERAGTGPVIASIWDVPDWMVTNPHAERERRLDPDLYPEVVETIAAWLLHARDTHGVTIAYVSFNEATLGVNVRLNPDEAADLISIAGPRFEDLGLSTKWLLGDCHNMGSCGLYVKALYAYEGIRPYLGPLAFHSWDARVPDQTLIRLGEFAEENGLEIWCTEAGWQSQLWETPEQYPTWQNAMSIATIYSRVLKLSGTTVLHYWQMMGGDYAINDGRAGYPVFHILRQYADQFPQGTVIVETSADQNRVHALAGQAPDHFVVQVINSAFTDLFVTLSGLPPGSYTHIRSTSEEAGTTVGTYEITDGSVGLEMPRGSVNVLTTRRP